MGIVSLISLSDFSLLVYRHARDLKQLKKINLQNIQAAHTVQYQKNKQPSQNVGRRPK